jgi:hypothetical protein
MPISAVHCASTAVIIQLVDTTSVEVELGKKAMQHFKGLLSDLQDMQIPWAWNPRLVRVLYNLAEEWSVSIAALREETPQNEDSTVSNIETEDRHSLSQGVTMYSEPSTFDWGYTDGAEPGWCLGDFIGSKMETEDGLIPGMVSDMHYLPFTSLNQ